jgi:hypothetical protein
MTYPFEPPDHFDDQDRMYHIIGFREDEQDSFWNPDFNQSVHDAFFDYWYNDELTIDERNAAYDFLTAMLFDEYGLDFDDLWDWDDFRAWYDSA